MSQRDDHIELRIEHWRRIREQYAEAETASSRSVDQTVTIRITIAGKVMIALDAHRCELTNTEDLQIALIDTYNSAMRRLNRGLRNLKPLQQRQEGRGYLD